jgi:hypothetical protein
MKLRLLVVAIVIAVIAAVAWMSRSVPGRSAEVLILSLRINGGMDGEIERGEPLRGDVFLTGRTSDARIDVGSTSQPWSRLVTLRDENNSEIPGAPVVLAAPRRTSVVRDERNGISLDQADGSVARIEGTRHLFIAELSWPPEVTERLAPGSHRVQAVLSMTGRFPWSARVEARSTAVTLVVREPRPEGEPRRLERTSRYHLHTGQFQEAKRLAEMLIARRPDDPGGQILLGDALKGQGDPRGARAAYIKALEMIRAGRRFYEDHEALFASIREAEKALVGAKRSP